MNPLTECLGWTLVHFLWQGAAIALLLAICLRLLRHKTSEHRYVAGCIALSLMALAPVLTSHLVAQRFHPSMIAVEEPPAAAPISPDVTPNTVSPGPGQTFIFKPVTTERNISQQLEIWLPWLVAGWAVGVLALSCRLLAGWLQIRRLQRTAVETLAEPWRQKLAMLAERLDIKRPLRLVQSAWIEVPTVIGWLRPVILLPASCLTGLTPAQLETILAHELAHIRRHDYLVNLLQSVVETLLFYHPAVWWVSRRIREERENCCDDIAVKICGDPVTYARALATLEEMRAAPAQLALAATGAPLLQRIQRLLGRSAGGAYSPTWPLAWLIVVVAVLTLATGLRGNRAAAAETMTPENFLTDFGVYHYTNAGTITDLTIRSNEVWVAASNELSRATSKAGTITWRAHRHWFVYLDKDLRAWAYDGGLGLWLVTAESTGSSSTSIEWLQERPPATAVKRLPKAIIEQLPSEQKSASHYRFSHLFQEGRVLFEANKLEEAEAKLQAACAEDPLNERAKSYLQMVQQRAAEFRDAELIQEGKLLFESGKPHEAESKLRKVLEHDPSNVAAHHYLDMIQQKRTAGGNHQAEPKSDNWGQSNTMTSHLSKGRQNLLSKLHTIRLPSVEYNEVPLAFVISNLNRQIKQLDPEGKGINIFIDHDTSVPVAAIPSVDSTSGLPLAKQPAEPVDLSSVKVKIAPALTNVLLGDVLDTITKAADQPIKFSVLDYAVVFSPRGQETVILRTHKFHVDPARFLKGIAIAGYSPRNFETNVASPQSQVPFINGGDSKRLLQTAVRQYFKSLGVDFGITNSTNGGKAIYFNDRAGQLLVRATSKDLDKVEVALDKLLFQKPQINIKAMFVEIDEVASKTSGLAWLFKGNVGPLTTNDVVSPSRLLPHYTRPPLTNMFNAKLTNSIRPLGHATLTDPQFQAVIKALEQREGVDILTCPQMTTRSDGQAEIQNLDFTNIVFRINATQPGQGSTSPYRNEIVGTGPELDLLPSVSTDGFWINMRIRATLTEFLGNTKATVPASEFRKYQLMTEVDVMDGQTLVLVGEEPETISVRQSKVPLLGHLFRGKSTSTPKKNLLVFLTPTLIYPDGTVFHTKEELAELHSTVPAPQPPPNSAGPEKTN